MLAAEIINRHDDVITLTSPPKFAYLTACFTTQIYVLLSPKIPKYLVWLLPGGFDTKARSNNEHRNFMVEKLDYVITPNLKFSWLKTRLRHHAEHIAP
jgi:hypothetical protein